MTLATLPVRLRLALLGTLTWARWSARISVSGFFSILPLVENVEQ